VGGTERARGNVAKNEDEMKADLLRYSYEQVLDATKHQDDKIGRLLTTTAFLTAASLALAGLGSAKAISVPVNLGGDSPSQPGSIAIGFICLVAFLIGVSITVIQLIGSLSTPLRLPGLDRARRGASNGGIPSTVYFHEIEKNTLGEWKGTWDLDSKTLTEERFRSLVGETHNLARRTSFKYNRTNEATAVLTWALIALSLTVSFAAIAVLDKSQPLLAPPGVPVTPVTLTLPDMVLVGSVLAIVTFVWSMARMRHSGLGSHDDARKATSWMQRAVVYGCAFSIFWAAGLPLFLEVRWQNVFQFGVGFLALFTATSMAWATWGQVATYRIDTGFTRLSFTMLPPVAFSVLGCLGYQVWWRPYDWPGGLPWAIGSVSGSVIATFIAKIIGHIELAPKRDTTPLPEHSGTALACDRCAEDRHLDSARRVRWRVLTILGFAAPLSFMAQNFHTHHAYAWPLAAVCAALTALIGVAVLEPTSLEARERRIRQQRDLHTEEVGRAGGI
jgi:hypothetical protein